MGVPCNLMILLEMSSHNLLSAMQPDDLARDEFTQSIEIRTSERRSGCYTFLLPNTNPELMPAIYAEQWH